MKIKNMSLSGKNPFHPLLVVAPSGLPNFWSADIYLTHWSFFVSNQNNVMDWVGPVLILIASVFTKLLVLSSILLSGDVIWWHELNEEENQLPSAYLISKVYDDKRDVGHARFLKVCTAGVLLVELLGPVLIRSLWHLKQQGDYIITEGGN